MREMEKVEKIDGSRRFAKKETTVRGSPGWGNLPLEDRRKVAVKGRVEGVRSVSRRGILTAAILCGVQGIKEC